VDFIKPYAVRRALAAVKLGGYKSRMRRTTRLGLAIFATLLVAAGAYSAYWFVVAGRIRESIAAWADSARVEKLQVSWKELRISGYPAGFRVDLKAAALRDNGLIPAPELRAPLLSGTARPWDLAIWRLTAPQGFTGELLGPDGRRPAEISAHTADGVVSIASEGGWRLWLSSRVTSVAGAGRVLVGSADAWVFVPQRPPSGHIEPMAGFAVNARQVHLPTPMGPLGDTIDDLDFGLTVRGAIPRGKLAQAMVAWRDSGGTVELDNLHLRWGALGATATGTIALDQELQPIGGFFGAIQGYDQILTVLVQSGHLRASDAGLARIALTMLAKAGPDGRPEIRTAFTIQNGEMFLGPAKLGKAPHLNWD
jgi:hypothetical protein